MNERIISKKYFRFRWCPQRRPLVQISIHGHQRYWSKWDLVLSASIDPAWFRSQTYSNSNRYQPNIGQDQIARAPIGQQRTSDLSNRLGTPVETTRPPAGRFVSDNQTAPNNMNPVNEVPPRFAQMGNRSLQQTSIRDSTAPTAPRNDESERTSNAPGGHGGYQTKIFQRQNYNSSQPNNNQRGDENLGSTNYSKQSEQRRPNDEPRFETPMNDRPMDNNDRRGGYQNRGGKRRCERENYDATDQQL